MNDSDFDEHWYKFNFIIFNALKTAGNEGVAGDYFNELIPIVKRTDDEARAIVNYIFTSLEDDWELIHPSYHNLLLRFIKECFCHAQDRQIAISILNCLDSIFINTGIVNGYDDFGENHFPEMLSHYKKNNPKS